MSGILTSSAIVVCVGIATVLACSAGRAGLDSSKPGARPTCAPAGQNATWPEAARRSVAGGAGPSAGLRTPIATSAARRVAVHFDASTLAFPSRLEVEVTGARGDIRKWQLATSRLVLSDADTVFPCVLVCRSARGATLSRPLTIDGTETDTIRIDLVCEIEVSVRFETHDTAEPLSGRLFVDVEPDVIPSETTSVVEIDTGSRSVRIPFSQPRQLLVGRVAGFKPVVVHSDDIPGFPWDVDHLAFRFEAGTPIRCVVRDLSGRPVPHTRVLLASVFERTLADGSVEWSTYGGSQQLSSCGFKEIARTDASGAVIFTGLDLRTMSGFHVRALDADQIEPPTHRVIRTPPSAMSVAVTVHQPNPKPGRYRPRR